MVVVSYSGKEINAKLVYYGPGLSGKTTNLEHIYKSVPQNSRGKMVSMKTRTERTLFFDFLPVDLGQLGGFKTRFLLYNRPRSGVLQRHQETGAPRRGCRGVCSRLRTRKNG